MKTSHITMAIVGSGTVAGAALFAVLATPTPVNANQVFKRQTNVDCSSCHLDAANPTKQRLTWVGERYNACTDPQTTCNFQAGRDETTYKAYLASNPRPSTNEIENLARNFRSYPQLPTSGGGYNNPGLVNNNSGVRTPPYNNPGVVNPPYNNTGVRNPPYNNPGVGNPPYNNPPVANPPSTSNTLGVAIGTALGILFGGGKNNATTAAPPPRSYQPPSRGFDPGAKWQVVQHLGSGRVEDGIWVRRPGTADAYDAIFEDSATGVRTNEVVWYRGIANGVVTFQRSSGIQYQGQLDWTGKYIVSGTVVSATNTRYPQDFTWSGVRSTR